MFPKKNHLGQYQQFMLVPEWVPSRTCVCAYIAEIPLGSGGQKEK